MQFFYAWLGINGVAKDKVIENALNESSLFWLIALEALAQGDRGAGAGAGALCEHAPWK
jgi:hypothetical protein